ncbi:hypothetical protein GIB67_042302 [Kingdonia uniflora]|uniref:Polymerase nucleotidyl transferase domain-containing protein n=1 Tax=Kingdonia uniflora TaxID=39325 RepID=A0A7J7LEA5_9MAGN|nr:hypothetical protein GIB67_042302 [Kingdonia uniflora]
MGDHDSWAQLNGLLPDKSQSVIRVLDRERWSRAEERVAELIVCIQPNKPSEALRNAVADYVQRLIMKCISCQVFIFGSVPLKTYLPDGDIDLTTFGKNLNSKDTWANEVRDMLLNEEKNENAEFRVKEVQYIQAEVKIIKCLVENIVVDISFNQLGGLCTLCFLEEVDHKIKQNHLFKRSIILIKAWCYYESRILGAHHGLISTYALETLVLYIFHVFNNSFAGPLEVLYRFLEFFSVFDWETFCVSLWGPVLIKPLTDMTALPPRKDRRKLLLDRSFLESCSTAYAVTPGSQENQGQPFVSKHFNVIDPLRANNNLGRSVSKAMNSFEEVFSEDIKLLTPQKRIETISMYIVDAFECSLQLGNFYRIRSAFAFGAKRLARLLDCPKENIIAEINQFFMNTWERHGSGRRPDASSVDLLSLRSINSDRIQGSENVKNSSSGKRINSSSTNESKISRTQSQKNYSKLSNSRVSDQVAKNISSGENLRADKGQRSSRKDYLINEVQAKYQFARTRSSPELTDTSNDIVSRSRRNKGQETGKSQMGSARPDYSRKKNLGSELNGTRARYSTEDASSRHSSDQGLDAYRDEATLGVPRGEVVSAAKSMEMHQEEQDLVNMMASSRLHGYSSTHVPFPTSHSVLASIGYTQKNYTGMGAQSFPLMDPRWCSNVQFSQSLVSPSMPHYFPNFRLASNSDQVIESSNGNFDLTEVNQDESDRSLWHDEDVGSDRGFDHSDSFLRDQDRFARENKGSAREDCSELSQYENDRVDEVYSTERNSNLRHVPTSQASSSKSKTSSESSWDGSSKKGFKLSRDSRGRRTAPSMKGSKSDYDNREWLPLSTTGTEMAPSVDSPRTNHQLPTYEPTQVSGPDPMMPTAPVVVGSGSRFFYFTGPPVPFITVLPYIPTDGNSEGSTRHLDRDDCMDKSEQNFNSADSLDKSEIFHNSSPTSEPSEEHKSDILNSDFTSHVQNLEYGRICQNSRYHGQIHPTPVMMPPVYMQGHFPWDGPGRPIASASNPFPQVVNSPRFVPVTTLQPGSNVPPSAYQQRFGDESPRYRGGTGTYLPNPRFDFSHRNFQKASFRERQSLNTRNQKGHYNYDRSDHQHNDKEGNWTSSSRPRTTGRSRSQADRPNSRSDRVAASDSRADKPWDSYRHDSFPSQQSQNGPFGSSNMPYGMYSPNSNGVATMRPSVLMLYPYDHNVTYGLNAEHLEFGFLGPLHLSGMNDDDSQLGEGSPARFQGDSPIYSSPDQPSSPEVQR